LQAQRWNSSAATPGWYGNVFLKGTSTPASNIVTLSGAAVVSGTNDIATSRWWALQDNTRFLPVTWLSQSTACENGLTTIRWSTATEQNTDYFTLEKSADGLAFSPIGSIPASGNSSTVKTYSYTDKEPFTGITYYRIRETDFNTHSSLSNIMAMSGCSPNNISIWGTKGGILVQAGEQAEYTFEMYNALGQKIMNEKITLTNNTSPSLLPLSHIAPGMYVVKASIGTKVISQKTLVH
jgi:hypothetical protein